MNWQGKFGVGASAERLESLIRQRLEPGANRAVIDRRIHDLFGETWAVMFTDLAGFSRNVAEFGIVHFLQTILESHRLLFPVVADHDGMILKTEGDSFLALFRRPERALQAAQSMQSLLDDYNAERPREEWVLLCIGLGYGEMLRIGDSDVYGVQVNAASKLGEDQARSGEILATEAFVQAANVPLTQREPLDKVPTGVDAAWRILGTE